MDEPRAILAQAVAYALPAGSRMVPARCVRPVPLAATGQLGLAMFDGQAVPVLRLQPEGAEAWVRLPTGLLVAGAALSEHLPAGALMLPQMPLAAAARPHPMPVSAGAGWSVPARRGRARFATLAAEIGGCRILLPFAVLRHVLPMPAVRAAPAMPRGIAGYAIAEGAPAVVLDPAALMPEAVHLPEPSLMVLFELDGRSIGLPCQRVGPAGPGEMADMRAIAAVVAAFGAAPTVTAATVASAEPKRGLLLCSAGGVAFAVAVEEVAAVIAPLVPVPATPHGAAPRDRVIAHRGDVLPVLDGGLRLAGRPVLPTLGSAAPLLRLLLARPVALAVTDVASLRQVPLSAIATTEGSGLVAGIATLPEGAVPICRAMALASPA